MSKSKKFEQKRKTPGKLNGSLLTHMRKVAFDDCRIEAAKTMKHAERLRDDQALLDAAEEKRKRKMAKRAGK